MLRSAVCRAERDVSAEEGVRGRGAGEEGIQRRGCWSRPQTEAIRLLPSLRSSRLLSTFLHQVAPRFSPLIIAPSHPPSPMNEFALVREQTTIVASALPMTILPTSPARLTLDFLPPSRNPGRSWSRRDWCLTCATCLREDVCGTNALIVNHDASAAWCWLIVVVHLCVVPSLTFVYYSQTPLYPTSFTMYIRSIG